MRDKKISILLFVSFLLLLASFLILCTWVYNYYTDNLSASAAIPKSESQQAEVTRDSLLKIYTVTIQSLESQLGNTFNKSDSVEKTLGIKLDEYYKLKDELNVLLKSPAANDDFKLAKQKITELQSRMVELRSTTQNIERENARLHKIIETLNKGEGTEGNTPAGFNGTNASFVSRSADEKPVIIPFTSSELSLTTINEDESDETDMFAANTQRKIVGSFAIRNSISFNNTEVIVVVNQPNGQVLQKSAWESGSFQSSEGKKIYSLKLNFGYTRGEVKRMSFVIETDKFTRGNYTLQIFNNGIPIGKITRLLS